MKVSVFFDGQNFYRSLQRYDESLRVDYDRLAAWITQAVGRPRFRAGGRGGELPRQAGVGRDVVGRRALQGPARALLRPDPPERRHRGVPRRAAAAVRARPDPYGALAPGPHDGTAGPGLGPGARACGPGAAAC